MCICHADVTAMLRFFSLSLIWFSLPCIVVIIITTICHYYAQTKSEGACYLDLSPVHNRYPCE